VDREQEVQELEQARLRRLPLAADLAASQAHTGPTLLGSAVTGQQDGAGR
jgi:hypothetical protein